MTLMNKALLKRLTIKLALAGLMVLPELANAQYLSYNQSGDVLAGFRKTGAYQTPFNLVADFGSVTNFMLYSPGATVPMSNLTATALTSAFTNFNNLQWSVFASVPGSGGITGTNPVWKSSLGNYPPGSLWFTLPSTNVAIQTKPPLREGKTPQVDVVSAMNPVGSGAAIISGNLGATNADNNSVLVVEPVVTYTADAYTTFVSDSVTGAGDFGSAGTPLAYDVENTTPSTFSTAQRSDFYQVCPYNLVDPITHSTNATQPYFIGYFILNPSGKMTFTRAFSVTASATSGSAPLQAVFSTTAASSSGATNWVWNFGNGTIITNNTAASVTNTYSAAGSYTVTLTLNEPSGPQVLTLANYVVVSSTGVSIPAFSSVLRSSGQLIFNGTNGAASAQYRILMSTNLVSGTWTPVFTNQFSGSGTFSYTNNLPAGPGEFFKLVSP